MIYDHSYKPNPKFYKGGRGTEALFFGFAVPHHVPQLVPSLPVPGALRRQRQASADPDEGRATLNAVPAPRDTAIGRRGIGVLGPEHARG
jgi:hypothetical protein